PALVSPLGATIGLGTISGISARHSRQAFRRRVSKCHVVHPAHRNGSPGKTTSTTSSAWLASSSNRQGESSQTSYAPGPVRTIWSASFGSETGQLCCFSTTRDFASEGQFSS